MVVNEWIDPFNWVSLEVIEDLHNTDGLCFEINNGKITEVTSYGD